MFILADIGGTKIRLAYAADNKTFGRPLIEKTPQDFEGAVGLIADLSKELSVGKELSRAVLGIPGTYCAEKDTLVWSPNLSHWKGNQIRKTFSEALGAPCDILNDADLAGLGEAVFGAGRGYKSVGFLTVSTGIGGGKIMDGEIEYAAAGFEPGHQIIGKDGETFEEIASGGGLKKRFGKDPRDIDDASVWKQVATDLSLGLYNTILHWSPDVFVLGGPMILGSPAIPFDEVKSEVTKKILKVFPKAPEIKKAELGDFCGLYGCLAHLAH